jgi:hypothetical protein
MKSFKNAISKTLKRATFPGPHWQKGFFDHVIRSEESYDQKWLYVRDNPVRRIRSIGRRLAVCGGIIHVARLKGRRAVIDRAYKLAVRRS